MRKELNKINMNGKIVIGEGELDEAPMLYIGENVGTKNGPLLDIAVDPLEGTNFVANNLPGALSVIAVANKSNLFNAPETYMNKIAVGKDVPFDATDLDYPIKKNISNIAEAKNKNINELTVCMLDRPRHKGIIEELKSLNVNLLIIYPDQMRGQAMGFLGLEYVKTPHLDKFAAQSLVLNQAVSNYPLCSPTRASFMTGQYPQTHGVWSNCNSLSSPFNLY